MSKEYQYKRYQLSLDPEDVKHTQIIDYLESHKAGKNRNEALIKVILAGFGEKVELDLPLNNPSHIKTEQRLKKMDGKLDKILWSLINQHGLKEVEYQEEAEEISEKMVYEPETEEIKNPLSMDDNQDAEQLVHSSIDKTPDILDADNRISEQDIGDDVQDLIPEGIMNFLNGL